MEKIGFKCKRCGNCCTNLGAHSATVPESDIQMWEENGRDDILEWVSKIEANGIVFSYDIWLDPDTGEDVETCPWLNRDLKTGKPACDIHNLKPAVCREYPLDKLHASETGCRGYE